MAKKSKLEKELKKLEEAGISLVEQPLENEFMEALRDYIDSELVHAALKTANSKNPPVGVRFGTDCASGNFPHLCASTLISEAKASNATPFSYRSGSPDTLGGRILDVIKMAAASPEEKDDTLADLAKKAGLKAKEKDESSAAVYRPSHEQEEEIRSLIGFGFPEKTEVIGPKSLRQKRIPQVQLPLSGNEYVAITPVQPFFVAKELHEAFKALTDQRKADYEEEKNSPLLSIYRLDVGGYGGANPQNVGIRDALKFLKRCILAERLPQVSPEAKRAYTLAYNGPSNWVPEHILTQMETLFTQRASQQKKIHQKAFEQGIHYWLSNLAKSLKSKAYTDIRLTSKYASSDDEASGYIFSQADLPCIANSKNKDEQLRLTGYFFPSHRTTGWAEAEAEKTIQVMTTRIMTSKPDVLLEGDMRYLKAIFAKELYA